MARLTPSEKRTILKLHNLGKTLKEIIEETGRSREAITKLFMDCGIGEGSIRMEQAIWQNAEWMYDKACRKRADYNRYPAFRNLTTEIQNNWYQQARKEWMDRAKLYVTSIMAEDEPKITQDFSEEFDKEESELTNEKILQNYIVEVEEGYRYLRDKYSDIGLCLNILNLAVNMKNSDNMKNINGTMNVRDYINEEK